MQNNHEATTPKRRGGRRYRKVIIGLLVGLLAGVAGFAAAAYLFRAQVTGSVKAGNVSAEWTSVQLDATNNPNVCSAATLNAGKAVITPGAGGYPGDACVFKGALKMKAGSSEDGKVVAAAMTVPVGWKATLVSGCGQTVPVGAGTAAVTIKVEMLPTALADGTTVTFGATDGVEVQPASAPAPTCT